MCALPLPVTPFPPPFSGSWLQSTSLVAPTPTSGDLFGSAVGLGDGLLAAVGSPGDSGGVGAVHLYQYR